MQEVVAQMETQPQIIKIPEVVVVPMVAGVATRGAPTYL